MLTRVYVFLMINIPKRLGWMNYAEQGSIKPFWFFFTEKIKIVVGRKDYLENLIKNYE